jgi:hypothetical protein
MSHLTELNLERARFLQIFHAYGIPAKARSLSVKSPRFDLLPLNGWNHSVQSKIRTDRPEIVVETPFWQNRETPLGRVIKSLSKMALTAHQTPYTVGAGPRIELLN